MLHATRIGKAMSTNQDLALEKSILGSMILEDKCRDAGLFLINGPEIFYNGSTAAIFKAIHGLSMRGDPIDLLTLSREIEASTASEEAIDLLLQITEDCATAANIEHYCKQLIGLYNLRRLETFSMALRNKAIIPGVYPETVLTFAESELFKIRMNQTVENTQHISELADQFDTAVDNAKSGIVEYGVPTGFKALDEMTCGLPKPSYTLIAGRTSMGKTALALQLVLNIAKREGPLPTLLFTLEMSKLQIFHRMASNLLGIPMMRIVSGHLSDNEVMQCKAISRAMRSFNIHVDSTKQITPMQVRAKARRVKAQHGLGVIIIDYIQRMGHDEHHKDVRSRVSAISHDLANIAGELDIPLLVLAQLNRDAAKRVRGKKTLPPQLIDVKECGDIEEDIDMAFLIHRPEYYNAEDEPGIAKIIVAKQRNGAVGTIDLRFEKHCTRFSDIQTEEIEPDSRNFFDD
jgi:replicative DNA helicase